VTVDLDEHGKVRLEFVNETSKDKSAKDKGSAVPA